MRTAGLAFDNCMRYTIFSDALPVEYGVKARNLVSRNGMVARKSLCMFERRIAELFGDRKKQ